MEGTKNTVSYAQKAEQKKYDQKTKMISIKYTPSDMDEYNRLKNYLDRTGQSKNGFIKSLINNFFETGQDLKPVEDKGTTLLQKRREKKEDCYLYCYVADESIQLFYDKFGENVADNIFNEFEEIVRSELEDVLEWKGDDFDNWVAEIEERVNDNEFENKSIEEICKELTGEL